jgi:heme-degrading monooxygenase HmoA
MPTLPWAPGRAAAQPTGAVVVLASRLELQSFWPIIGFVRAALAVRKQARESPGALGVSLIAQPTRKTFWTLSAWVDQTALDAFVAKPPHEAVMTHYRPDMAAATFATFTIRPTELPRPNSNAHDLWELARHRLRDADENKSA